MNNIPALSKEVQYKMYWCWLIAESKASIKEVADRFNVKPTTVYKWISKYKQLDKNATPVVCINATESTLVKGEMYYALCQYSPDGYLYYLLKNKYDMLSHGWLTSRFAIHEEQPEAFTIDGTTYTIAE